MSHTTTSAGGADRVIPVRGRPDAATTPDSVGQENTPVSDAASAASDQSDNHDNGTPVEIKTDEPTKRKPAPGKIIPTRGFKGQRYRIYKRLNRADWVPRPNRRMRLEGEIELCEQEIRFITANTKIVIVFVNKIGGAGKSIVAAFFGQILGHITHRKVLLMPATDSPDTSTTAMYAGIPASRAMGISRFYSLIRRIPLDKVFSMIPRTDPYGLAVVTQDPEGSIGAKNAISPEVYRQSLEAAAEMSEVLLLDTGTDSVNEEALVLEAFRSADVAVFTATPGKWPSMLHLAGNIGRYSTDLEQAEYLKSAGNKSYRSGRQISSREKAQRSLALFTGVKRGRKPDDYVKFTMREGTKKPGDQNPQPISVGFQGIIEVIPFMKAWRKKRKNEDSLDIQEMLEQLVANPGELTRKEYLAWCKAIRSTLRLGVELQGLNLKFDPENPEAISQLLQRDDDEIEAYYKGKRRVPKPDHQSDEASNAAGNSDSQTTQAASTS